VWPSAEFLAFFKLGWRGRKKWSEHTFLGLVHLQLALLQLAATLDGNAAALALLSPCCCSWPRRAASFPLLQAARQPENLTAATWDVFWSWQHAVRASSARIGIGVTCECRVLQRAAVQPIFLLDKGLAGRGASGCPFVCLWLLFAALCCAAGFSHKVQRNAGGKTSKWGRACSALHRRRFAPATPPGQVRMPICAGNKLLQPA
jgi:hypothetical protein